MLPFRKAALFYTLSAKMKYIWLDYWHRYKINLWKIQKYKTNQSPPRREFNSTRTYCHLLADVHFAGFAPAFTLSFHDSECSRKPPNAHSLGC
jgi:hypothetical protein